MRQKTCERASTLDRNPMGSNKQVRPCRLQLEVPAQDLVQRWVRVRFGRYLPPTAVQSSAQALHLGLELVSAKLSPYLTEASLLECLQWALEAALQCAGTLYEIHIFSDSQPWALRQLHVQVHPKSS